MTAAYSPERIIISLSPPLCISVDEVDRIIDILDGAIGDMEDKFVCVKPRRSYQAGKFWRGLDSRQ